MKAIKHKTPEYWKNYQTFQKGKYKQKKHINKYASLEMLHDAQGSEWHDLVAT